MTGLTERECEVLSMLSAGFREREIVQTLGVSESRVRGIVRNAVRKMRARDRIQLIAWFNCELFQIGLEVVQ